MNSKEISQRALGGRVRVARENAQLTQEDLASRLGLKDRQSISDIENGKRAIKANELLSIAEATGVNLESLLEPFSVQGEAEFSWRADPTIDPSVLESFEEAADGWIGLLRWLRQRSGQEKRALRQMLRISSKSSYEDAIQRAEELVNELALGMYPALNLVSKIEDALDIPVLFVDPKDDSGRVSGATCHLDDLIVILINRLESECRRNFDIAHELFHALTWESLPPERVESNQIQSGCVGNNGRSRRVEQLADNFAAALLMPTTSIEVVVDKARIEDLAYLSEVACGFRVAPSALAWRLFNMRYITRRTCDALVKIASTLGMGDAVPRFSKRFVSLLHDAIDKGALSGRRAAKAIGMRMQELAELFAEHKLTTSALA